MRCPCLMVRQEKKDEFDFPPPFVLLRPSWTEWYSPTVKRAIYLTESTNSSINHLETPSKTQCRNMFNLGIPWPVKLMHEINSYKSIPCQLGTHMHLLKLHPISK